MNPIKTSMAVAIALCSFYGTCLAQFPLENFRKASVEKSIARKIDTVAHLAITDTLKIDMTQPIATIIKAIDDYKTTLGNNYEIKDASGYSNIDPYYANNISLYLNAADSAIVKKMTALQSVQPTNQDESVKDNAVIVQLSSLDAYIKSVKKDYDAINRLMGRPKQRNNFFPAHNAADSKLIYGTLDTASVAFGTSFTFLGAADKAAVNPEIINGYFGAIRVSINTLISTTTDTSVAAQSRLRLISGGGNTAITFSYPIYRFSSSNFFMLIHFAPKFIADFPLLGASELTKSNFVGSVNIAPEVLIKLYTSTKNIGFFANFRASKIYGSHAYLDNLDLNVQNSSFSFGQLNAGLFVSASFQVSVTMPVYASSGSLMRTPVLITTQIFPGASKK